MSATSITFNFVLIKFFILHVYSMVTRLMKKIRLNVQKVGSGQVTGKWTTTELWTTKVTFHLQYALIAVT